MVNLMIPTLLIVTMDILLLVIAVLLSGVARVKTNLEEDIRDIINVRLLNNMKKLAHNYTKYDRNFECAINYINSDPFKTEFMEFRYIKEVNQLVAYLNESDFNIDKYTGEIWQFLKDLETNTSTESCVYDKYNLKPFLQEVDYIFSSEEVTNIIDYKIDNSPAFRSFIRALEREKCKNLMKSILSFESKFLEDLKKMGFNFEKYMNLLGDALGWNT